MRMHELRIFNVRYLHHIDTGCELQLHDILIMHAYGALRVVNISRCSSITCMNVNLEDKLRNNHDNAF